VHSLTASNAAETHRSAEDIQMAILEQGMGLVTDASDLNQKSSAFF